MSRVVLKYLIPFMDRIKLLFRFTGGQSKDKAKKEFIFVECYFSKNSPIIDFVKV